MPRRLTVAIISLILGGVWMLVVAVPRVSGEEEPVSAKTETTAKETPAKETPKPQAAQPEAESNSDDAPQENADAEKYRLAYKFDEGEKVYYEVDYEMVITTSYNGASEVARNRSEARKHYRVVKVEEDGSAELELMIDWVRMTARFGDDPGSEFDSSAPAEKCPPKFKHILNMVGKPQAIMQFSPEGKLVDVKSVAEGAVAGSDPKTSQTRDTDADGNKTFLTILPEEPVAVGHEWSEKFELRVTVDANLMQPIKLMRKYKLESVEGNTAKISLKTIVLTPVNNPAIAAQLIQRETKGTITFDLERGKILSRQISIDKSVIAPFGPKTAMQAVSRHDERLTPNPSTAKSTDAKPGAASKN